MGNIKMKFIFLIAAVAAHRIHHKDVQEGNHWRKPWPQGIDNGDDDDTVLPREPKNRLNSDQKPKPPPEKYPWSYDEDVIGTGNSIDKAEGITKEKLTYNAVAAHRGLDMIHRVKYMEGKYDRRADEPEDA